MTLKHLWTFCGFFSLLISLASCAPSTLPATPITRPQNLTYCEEATATPYPIWQGLDDWLFYEADLVQDIDPRVPIYGELVRLNEAFKKR